MSEPNNSQSTPTTGGTHRSRWLIYALVASLALNLLIAGIFIGTRLHGDPDQNRLLHHSGFSVGRAIRDFDHERQTRLWPLAKPHYRGIRNELRSLRHAQRQWNQAYKADPVDLAALDASQATLSKHHARMQQMNFAAIRALAAELSATERAQLLTAMRHSRRQSRDGAHANNPKRSETRRTE